MDLLFSNDLRNRPYVTNRKTAYTQLPVFSLYALINNVTIKDKSMRANPHVRMKDKSERADHSSNNRR